MCERGGGALAELGDEDIADQVTLTGPQPGVWPSRPLIGLPLPGMR